MRTAILTVAVLALMPLRAARAQGETDAAATALSLFEQGRQLVTENKAALACPKFLESMKLVAKVSTLLNLADCYERTGKLAGAWARFTEAAAMASREGQSDREAVARQRAAMLEPRLAKLTIRAPSPAEGVTIKRDGEAVDATMLGVAIPVDPGAHVVEVTAPGKAPWSTTVQAAQGTSVAVVVPVLQDASSGAAAPSQGSTEAVSASDQTTEAGATRRIIGLAVGGAGVVSLAVGGVFAVLAADAKSAYEKHCGANIGAPSGFCDPQGISGHDDASTKALLSTVVVAAGVGLAAAGAYLYFTAPRGGGTTQVGVGLGEVTVRGWF